MEELASCMRRFPQVLLNVPVADPRGSRRPTRCGTPFAGPRTRSATAGRVLVRASGTEPLVRVMVEAEVGDDADRHAGELADAVRASLGGS